MNESIINIAGWIPTIVFPVATSLQLLSIYKRGSAKGVSGTAWLLFAIANIGLYIYTEKYFEWQTIIALLGTAMLDFSISILAFIGYQKKP